MSPVDGPADDTLFCSTWLLTASVSIGVGAWCHFVAVLLMVCNHCIMALDSSWAGRDWGQEEKGTTEDEMAGWHH